LSVSVEALSPTAELILNIHNHDSPPLQITGVRVQRRPVYIVFRAGQSGDYHLLAGNSRCTAPRYDLATLAANLTNLAVSALAPGPLMKNPAYRLPEALPMVEDTGALLDASPWKCRKPVLISRPGAQQLDLDLEVIAHSRAGFQDLRMLRDARQLPFVLERSSLTRAIVPSVTYATDRKNVKISRWTIKLPYAGLPLTRLVCISPTQLFSRDIELYEEAPDERGDKHRRWLAQAAWAHKPGQATQQFMLMINTAPETDTLFLETNDRDNPAISLASFQLFYQVTRLIFKTAVTKGVALYYGNADAQFPSYDLALVASELLGTEKAVASLGPEEQLKEASWREQFGTTGKGNVLLWGVLALVVAGLLIVIVRFLPKSPGPSAEDKA
jgi:hypothetical protein